MSKLEITNPLGVNHVLRGEAVKRDVSFMDLLLQKIKSIESETGIPRTVFAACPNSTSVIKASLRAAKRNNAPIKFAATLNQVDGDGGYTGLTPDQFVFTIWQEAFLINFNGPVIIAIDHGGPWLKDKHNKEKWRYEDSMNAVKRSFEAAIQAGYDLIHVDPTIDITLKPGEHIRIEVVAERTVELILHAENFRKKLRYPRIAYEVGTEEVHGGLADLSVFTRFLDLLKSSLEKNGLKDVWPCFVVGKVGTDLHTSVFDPEVAERLSTIAKKYGSLIKGHYSDNVTNPEDYPKSGMGAANVGPEFTEQEYDGLIELVDIENSLFNKALIAKPSDLTNVLWAAVIQSQRWKKWLLANENAEDFYQNDRQRQLWLVKTGCRYIWENPEVLAARGKLNHNLKTNGFNAEEILLARIEKSMDKYFHKFNLVDLNDMLL